MTYFVFNDFLSELMVSFSNLWLQLSMQTHVTSPRHVERTLQNTSENVT